MTRQIHATQPNHQGYNLAHTHARTHTVLLLPRATPQTLTNPWSQPSCLAAEDSTHVFIIPNHCCGRHLAITESTPAPTCHKIAVCSIRLTHAHTDRKQYRHLSSQAKEAGAVSRPQPPLCTAYAVHSCTRMVHNINIVRLTSGRCRYQRPYNCQNEKHAIPGKQPC